MSVFFYTCSHRNPPQNHSEMSLNVQKYVMHVCFYACFALPIMHDLLLIAQKFMQEQMTKY